MGGSKAADKRPLSMMSMPSWDQPPRAPIEYGTATNERVYHMRIDRDGIWHHEGRPIAREALVKLFATVLRREPDGSHWLVTPVERGRIEVEDAPFVIIELRADGAGQGQMIRLRSNLDAWVTLGKDHPLHLRSPKNQRDEIPIPYVDVGRGLEARLLRPVYYELAELLESVEQDGIPRTGVWSGGVFFPLES